MNISLLKIKNFRNYSEYSVEFSSGNNFLTGRNGAGKSNIIEALSVSANLKSFRSASDRDIIKKGSAFYYISMDFFRDYESRAEVGFGSVNEKYRKKLKLDGNEVKKVADYYGRIITVILSPDDINIVNGSPEKRRKLVDSIISKADPEYLHSLTELRKILESRNSLLKRGKDGSSLKEIEVWNEMLSKRASLIIKKRVDFTSKYSALFKEEYSSISDGLSDVTIEYMNHTGESEPDAIYERLKSTLNKDFAIGSTSTGPQKDDFAIMYDGALMTASASQGEKRSASIALKSAEKRYIEDSTGEMSVILIDDVLAELDSRRRENVVSMFGKDNQIIYTMVNCELISRELLSGSNIVNIG